MLWAPQSLQKVRSSSPSGYGVRDNTLRKRETRELQQFLKNSVVNGLWCIDIWKTVKVITVQVHVIIYKLGTITLLR